MAIYQEVAQTLEAEIRDTFRSGEYLPSEAQLAERFAINRHTVRRAIDELVQAGMVLRQQGKGTLVLEHSLQYRIGARGRFSESVEALGHHPDSSVIGRYRLQADDTLARKMWVEPGTDLIQIDTLRCIDGKPATLISHYLPAHQCPGLAQHYQGGSLHQLLESRYGFRLTRRQGLISAGMPTQQESLLLRYPCNRPLLKIASNNLCIRTGALVEYSLSRSRADCFEYKIEPGQNPLPEGELST